MAMAQHTSQEFESELRTLKDRILAMGGRCERLTRQAIQALESQDRSLAAEVEETDRQINADELAVDDLAVRILALRQPVGRDLRFLLTALKVVVDLERIGDEAVNIAERAAELAGQPGELPHTQGALSRMVSVAVEMLHEALDAYVEEDADKAKEVLLRDDEVDELYGQILREAIEFMKKNPDRIVAAMNISSCAKYIERIADHSTNIAEMVVYMVRGVDVRHRGNR
jgi:phosphate transport system protein